MTRKQYIESYETEKNLMAAGIYPYESPVAREKAKMLNCRASLLCSMIQKEGWNKETKDREIKKILTDVGLEIAKAEGNVEFVE